MSQQQRLKPVKLTPAEQELANAKQVLVDAEAELAQREQVEANQDRREAELNSQISTWRGQMEIDHVDHTDRIATAQAEIAEIEAEREKQEKWADAKKVLHGRIVKAQEAVNEAELAVKRETLETNLETDREQYRAFAEALLTFTKAANALAATRQERQLLCDQMWTQHRINWRNEGPATTLPAWPTGAIGSKDKKVAAGALATVEAMLAELN